MMANQAQRQDEEQPQDEQQPQRADPRQAQYVINITPEQYESQLRQRQVKTAEVAPRTQIPMGGSGTATVSFQDSAGDDVQIKQVAWSATGPVTVVGDDTNPTSAKITPVGLGPAHVTATGQSDKGSAEAHVEVMVIEPAGAPVVGTIEVTAEPGEEGAEGATFSYGGQTLPVPPAAPPKDAAYRIPPAQTLAQPSPQPQPQEEPTEPPPEEIPPPEARRD